MLNWTRVLAPMIDWPVEVSATFVSVGRSSSRLSTFATSSWLYVTPAIVTLGVETTGAGAGAGVAAVVLVVDAVVVVVGGGRSRREAHRRDPARPR